MKGQFHGLGVYSWANGASYEGDHVKDQRTGFGVMTYPDGAAFSGIWEDGVHKEFRESRDSLPLSMKVLNMASKYLKVPRSTS